MGATGLAFLPILLSAQSNWGVLTAGKSTIVSWTSSLSWNFGAKAIGEAADSRLGAAIDRSERNGTIGERRADIDDHATVTHPHSLERGHHPMHLSEIGNARAPLDLRCGEARNRSKNRRHCDIDPHVDGSELRFNAGRRRLDLIGIGHVGRNCQRSHAVAANLQSCTFETTRIARKQPELSGMLRSPGDVSITLCAAYSSKSRAYLGAVMQQRRHADVDVVRSFEWWTNMILL